MAGFGLQFLNGVGESEEQSVQYADLENKSFVTDEDFTVEKVDEDVTSDNVSASANSVQSYHEEKSKIVTCKNLLIFLAGAVTGLAARKLLKKK